MGPTKNNARAAPCHKAGLERIEKVPKVVGPRLGVLGRLRVEVLAGAGEDVVEAVLPLGHVGIVDWALGCSARLGLGLGDGSGHFERGVLCVCGERRGMPGYLFFFFKKKNRKKLDGKKSDKNDLDLMNQR